MSCRFRGAFVAIVCFAPLAVAAGPQDAQHPNAGGRAVCDRVRFKPAPSSERDMVGGKFSGSNVSATEGYELLAEIKTPPAKNEWTELKFDGRRPHRWLRNEGPPGSHGRIGKLEFYAGSRRLHGQGFGSIGGKKGHYWPQSLNPLPNGYFDGEKPEGQYVGIDTMDAATAVRPVFDPPPGDLSGAATVTLKTPTPGASIRYTLDGTTPGPDSGMLYDKPICVDGTTTITAVSLKPGFAPSWPTVGTYLVGAPKRPQLTTFHIGNSITQTTARFADYARTAGYRHDYRKFVRPGIQTFAIWQQHVATGDPAWHEVFAPIPRLDHFTMQPRQMDVAEEAKHDLLFINLATEKSPGVQPWLYSEWTDLYHTHPTNTGALPNPSSQMHKLVEALTWEEQASAWLLYVEEVQEQVLAKSPPGKRLRILPSTLAVGWIKNLIDRGDVPGMKPKDFYEVVFHDSVHPGKAGAYLVDMTWFAAMYGKSPEGKVLPINTPLTAEQAAVFQRLAWDVVKNYPDCGLYDEGSVSAGAPRFAPAVRNLSGVTQVTLSSATPGAWFRYTLDGTEPTRTRGYVYCGVVSVRPGMTLKALAYRSGMADSPVATAEY